MESIRSYPVIAIAAYISAMILGLLCVLPNFFGEDAVIDCVNWQEKNLTKLKEEYSHYRFKEISDGENLDVRIYCPSIPQQLKLVDDLKKAFPTEQTTLNLIPRSPRWLSMLGFRPLKLGLDLKGGVHFVLGVDTDEIIGKKQDSFLRDIEAYAKTRDPQAMLTFGDAHQKSSLRFSSREMMVQVASEISQRWPQQQVLYAMNEPVLELSFHPFAEAEERVALAQATLESLQKRVNELGVAESTLYLQGTQRIIVDLPGVQDIAQAEKMLGKTATIDFYRVAQTQWKKGDRIPLGVSMKQRPSGEIIFLHLRPILAGSAIVSAQATMTEDGKAAVDLRIQKQAAEQFKKLTASMIGEALAVMYRESSLEQQWNADKNEFETIPYSSEKILTVATIMNPLSDRFQITGMSYQQALDLALMIRAGALPAPVKILEEKILGPSLGSENIMKGGLALGTGLVSIFAFMAWYYGRLGWIANAVLLSNFCFMMIGLHLLQATLTMTGILGIILTLGMAVDANVLIFERMRDEKTKGSPGWAVLDLGVGKAADTIIDSNLTTMIIGIVLFVMGSSIVRGFAITLILGLMTSMMSSIWGTKTFLALMYKNELYPQIGLEPSEGVQS